MLHAICLNTSKFTCLKKREECMNRKQSLETDIVIFSSACNIHMFSAYHMYYFLVPVIFISFLLHFIIISHFVNY